MTGEKMNESLQRSCVETAWTSPRQSEKRSELMTCLDACGQPLVTGQCRRSLHLSVPSPRLPDCRSAGLAGH